jgi:hypothetical protein
MYRDWKLTAIIVSSAAARFSSILCFDLYVLIFYHFRTTKELEDSSFKLEFS